MGAGASASAVIDERAAFKTMEREYLRRGGSCMSDPAAGIAELKAIWLQLLAGETVDDDRTLVEIVGPEQFKVEKQNVIDTVLRMFDINGDGTLSRGESRQSTGSTPRSPAGHAPG